MQFSSDSSSKPREVPARSSHWKPSLQPRCDSGRVMANELLEFRKCDTAASFRRRVPVEIAEDFNPKEPNSQSDTIVAPFHVLIVHRWIALA